MNFFMKLVKKKALIKKKVSNSLFLLLLVYSK